MAPLYYRGALAAILVYDVTDESSFDDIKIWLEGKLDSSSAFLTKRMLTSNRAPRTPEEHVG